MNTPLRAENISASAIKTKKSGLSLYRAIRCSFNYTQTIVFYLLLAAVVVSGLTMLEQINQEHMVSVPTLGGELIEGEAGPPHFINPVLAQTDTDRDLSALIYAGLYGRDEHGTLAPALAASSSVSSGGLVYTVRLRDGAAFQDGQKVTSDDVAYTVAKISDPAVKSPFASDWQGITVATPDSKTVVFTLKQPYPAFLDNLTIGILPKHLWMSVPSELFAFSENNLVPVGAGSYQIAGVNKTSSGQAQDYTLVPSAYALNGVPKIAKIKFKFYQNQNDAEQALTHGDIQGLHSVSPAVAHYMSVKNYQVFTTTLPRVFAVFLNQNKASFFAQKEVRQALDVALDKRELVNKVLDGYGTAIDGPLSTIQIQSRSSNPALSASERILAAQALLQKGGWTLNTTTHFMEKEAGKKDKSVKQSLAFTLVTVNTPELRAAAVYVANAWNAIGARVTVQTLELGDAQENVIRPRSYQALLFGEIVMKELDLYSFWHSSERLDPGLNVGLYANVQVDKLLDRMRLARDTGTGTQLVHEIATQIADDLGAVFLYAPSLIYVEPASVHGVTLDRVVFASDRFNNIEQWYIDEERIWPIFKNNR